MGIAIKCQIGERKNFSSKVSRQPAAHGKPGEGKKKTRLSSGFL
jgi:hypothetical protein